MLCAAIAIKREGLMDKPTVFFGYASRPELSRDALFAATEAVTSTGLALGRAWEQLRVSGRVIINQIFGAIDEAELAAFDVSTLNENVLFELGYSIARGKRVWLLLDKTDAEAKARWRQFRLLSTVGYQGWANSEDIKIAFVRDQPHVAESTIYDDMIEPSLGGQSGASIFYMPSFHDTEASKRIGRRLDVEVRRGVRLMSADPRESALSPLGWYAQKVVEASATVVHFMARRRELAHLQNARLALVAGMAAGFEKPILILAEEDYSDPIDYRDVLHHYGSAAQSQSIVDEWLRNLGLQPPADRSVARPRQAAELRALRFGEHVAENETDLLSDYFIETAAFDEVMTSRNTLFVGRKGAGKTANMLQAAARLSEDARNLVVMIKPAAYEMEGLVGLLSRLPRDVKAYTVLALWSFLLQSEIARAAVEVVESRPSGVPLTEAERDLVRFVTDTDFGLREEFAVRFERTVRAIEEIGLVEAKSVGAGRDMLNEALHDQAIRRLRSLIGPVLKGRNRVAVLIDNLDKAWDRAADLDAVSQLLLGLLAAVGRVSLDYEKEDFWRDRVTLSLATFLRSDIYAYLQRAAREPDKIPTSTLTWTDPRLLLRVIEERFLASQPDGTEADNLWSRFFCPQVHGRPTSEYLTWRVLPRPRDIVYLCNAATIAAVNRRRDRIEEEDFLLAEQTYSQFAFEALLVENGITITQLEDVLLEFAGWPHTVTRAQALGAIDRVIGDDDKAAEVFSRLAAMSFLGFEVKEDKFEYPEVGPETKRADVLARKLSEERGGEARLSIHPAYRPFLEIDD